MIGKTGRILVLGIVIVGIFLTLMGWIALFGISSKSTIAENMTVTLNVNNIAPSVTSVSINDGAGTLTLTQGDSVTVVCNGTLNDTNGVGDIANATADFYNGSVNELSSPFSNQTHYRNNTCFVMNDSLLSTVAYAVCTFQVYYFAINTTWTCNLTGTDYDNSANASTDTILINDLVAVDVNDSIDYGALNPLQTGTNRTTVSNIGNVQIDLGLYGYSRYVRDNLSFNCTGGNQNISIDLHRYNLTNYSDSGSWSNAMKNLTAIQINETAFNLPASNGTSNFNSTKLVYWAIQVPTGVKGFCRGFVVYNAQIG